MDQEMDSAVERQKPTNERATAEQNQVNLARLRGTLDCALTYCRKTLEDPRLPRPFRRKVIVPMPSSSN